MAVFVTGATGMLGREIVPRMLARGDKVYALSRGKNHLPEGVIPLRGDITLRQCGLETVPDDIDEVWHMAALTSFRTKDDDLLDMINHLGTMEVLEIFKKASRFVYVSTVYVCGDTTGPFAETDLDVGQKFRNKYESSKFTAEQRVRDLRPDATIFRPGILVGRHSDASIASFSGFYRPLRAIAACHKFAEQHLGFPRREVVEKKLGLPRLHVPVRASGDPAARMPMTPIDWAAGAMLSSAYLKGQTLHIVPAEMPLNQEVTEGVCDGLGIEGFHFSREPRKNPLDYLYNRLIRDYLPYIRSCPAFTTSVGHTCPPVDRAYIARVVEYWRNNDLEFSGSIAEAVQGS